MQVGDWAVAIGSPFGFQATVTAGIISAKERDIPGDSSQFQHFLQTDAAINPGNSGGPLLNIRGEVIGINTAIASRSGGYQGIGFALPINTAVRVYNEIIKTGKVTRGGIGVSVHAFRRSGHARAAQGLRRERRRLRAGRARGRSGGQGRHQERRHHRGHQRQAGDATATT